MKLDAAENRAATLGRFLKMPDGAQLSGKDASVVLHIREPEPFAEFGDYDPDEDYASPWTVTKLWEALFRRLAREDRREIAEALSARVQLEVKRTQKEMENVAIDLERLRRERLLPDGPTLDKIARYEAHLNRLFYQALHELEALQTRRRGGQAPLARVDVQGLPEK
jgi:hypothetical protein